MMKFHLKEELDQLVLINESESKLVLEISQALNQENLSNDKLQDIKTLVS